MKYTLNEFCFLAGEGNGFAVYHGEKLVYYGTNSKSRDDFDVLVEQAVRGGYVSDPDDVDMIRIRTDGKIDTFVRSGNTWKVCEDVHYGIPSGQANYTISVPGHSGSNLTAASPKDALRMLSILLGLSKSGGYDEKYNDTYISR